MSSMTPINWKRTQQALATASYPVGKDDGIAGYKTFSCLFAYAAKSKVTPLIQSITLRASKVLPDYGITDSAERLADFLAQASHESASFTRLEENLRYSAKRLCQVWPKRFPTIASALPYAWDPTDPDREDIALANKTYGSRMGNELDGLSDNDGWAHRGRGIFMLTGYDQYKAAEKRLQIGLLNQPEKAAEPEYSLLIAADYWKTRKVGQAIDRGDTTSARILVNGGTLGLAEINSNRTRLMRILV